MLTKKTLKEKTETESDGPRVVLEPQFLASITF